MSTVSESYSACRSKRYMQEARPQFLRQREEQGAVGVVGLSRDREEGN